MITVKSSGNIHEISPSSFGGKVNTKIFIIIFFQKYRPFGLYSTSGE
jgi:hypothetical protein